MRFINAESNNKVLLDGAAGVIGCLAEGTSQICFFFVSSSIACDLSRS